MSLVGIYKNDHSGGVLEITTVNDIIGQGTGNFTMGDACISITLDYDLMSEGGTTILFYGAENNPNHYTGASGYIGDNEAIIGIQFAGGITLEKVIMPFYGFFRKQ